MYLLKIIGMNENSKAYELNDDMCNLSIISTQSTLDNYSNSSSLNTTFGSNNTTLNTTINNNNNNGNSTLISTNSNALTSSIINDTASTINDNISITNNINNVLNSVNQNNCTNNINTANTCNTIGTLMAHNNNINQSLSINITDNGNNLGNNNVSNNENNSNQQSVSASSTSVGSNETMFSVGDKVKIAVSLDIFKKMQEGHGGWNYKMADVTKLLIKQYDNYLHFIL